MSDAKPSNGEVFVVTDSLGRQIEIKTPGPVDTLNLLEAAGENANNPAWVRMAMLVFSVRKIGEVPFPATTKKDMLLARADRLGNEGLAAVYERLFATPKEAEPAADGSETPPVDPDLVAAKN